MRPFSQANSITYTHSKIQIKKGPVLLPTLSRKLVAFKKNYFFFFLVAFFAVFLTAFLVTFFAFFLAMVAPSRVNLFLNSRCCCL
jgi:hypothetical protein